MHSFNFIIIQFMLNNYVKTPVVPLLSQASRQQLNSKLSLFGLVSSKPESSETSSSSDSCVSFRYLNSSATPAETTGTSHPSPINMSGLGQESTFFVGGPEVESQVPFKSRLSKVTTVRSVVLVPSEVSSVPMRCETLVSGGLSNANRQVHA